MAFSIINLSRGATTTTTNLPILVPFLDESYVMLSFEQEKEKEQSILLEDFAHPTHTWKAKNDPVMGGKSTGTVSICDGLGIFDGQVVNVPFLQSPGFITMETRGGVYPDVSACQGLAVHLRATEPYQGYRLSFGNVHVPGGRFAYGYKANLEAPLHDFATIFIPFVNFTAKWDDATGDAIVTCQQDAKYCPTQQSLQNLQNMIFWGEGVAGKVHLEIAWIAGAQCDQEEMAAPWNSEMGAHIAPSWTRTTTTSKTSSGTTVDGWLNNAFALVLIVTVLLAAMVKLISSWHQKKQHYTVLQDGKPLGHGLMDARV